MKQEEKKFQRKLIQFVKDRNAFVFNFIGNAFQSGVPDLFVAHRYWSGWLELKVDAKVTSQQRHNLTELKKRGQSAYVLRFRGGQYTLSGPDETGKIHFPNMEALWDCLTQAGKEQLCRRSKVEPGTDSQPPTST